MDGVSLEVVGGGSLALQGPSWVHTRDDDSFCDTTRSHDALLEERLGDSPMGGGSPGIVGLSLLARQSPSWVELPWLSPTSELVTSGRTKRIFRIAVPLRAVSDALLVNSDQAQHYAATGTLSLLASDILGKAFWVRGDSVCEFAYSRAAVFTFCIWELSSRIQHGASRSMLKHVPRGLSSAGRVVYAEIVLRKLFGALYDAKQREVDTTSPALPCPWPSTWGSVSSVFDMPVVLWVRPDRAGVRA